MVSNPVMYNSRYRLARKWLEEMNATANVVPHLIEVAFGDRQHELVSHTDENHLQLRTRTEAWCKESAINVGVRSLLPQGWKYVAWVDSDLHFRDPQWAQKTLHQLQHWHVVQPWSQCCDLGANGNVFQLSNSFGYIHQSGKPKQRHKPGHQYSYAHPGYAWACTRHFWEQTQGLLDFCILGSADYHMAWSMIGDGEWTVNKGLHSSYHRRVKAWQDRAVRLTHGHVGFVNGRIEHGFHGSKTDRGYRSRWKVLLDHKYDPDTDLMYDQQGLIKLCNKHQLEESIRHYNRSRNEDGINEV
jgi:hypothetical protein